MKKIFFILLSAFITYGSALSQIIVTPTDISNFQNGVTQAVETDVYLDNVNNLYYLGLSDGKVKLLQDSIKTNSTLTGNGFNGSLLGLAQQSAASGQILSWNGSAWIPANAAPATTTVSNTVTAPNSLTTTVNSVTGTSVNMVTGVSNTSSANLLSTTVNGITGSTAPIINSISNSIATGQLTTTVNGIASTAVTLPVPDGSETKINNGTNTTVSGSGTTGSPYTINVSDATSGTKGVVQLTGDLAGTATSPAIAANAVNSSKILDGTVANADMENMVALSVKGNATNASAPPTDITAGTDGHVLRRSGTTLGFGQLTSAGIVDNTITYAKMQNTSGLRLLGNPTGSSAVPSEISLGTGLSFSGSVLNATTLGTVTNVSGTSPISVTNGTTTPVIAITRNNILAGTSSNVAINPLVLDAGATNAVVGGANATLTVNNTAPLWNANQLQGRNLSNTVPTDGQSLIWSGINSNWAPGNLSLWQLTGNSNVTYNTHFLGTTNDVPLTLRSNNTAMLELGRRQTLGLYDSTNTGIFPYNQQNASVSYVRGTGGNSALQFEASGASFYKPIFFTDSDGNFMMRGSSATTDFFELGSAGASNNGSLLFTIGDDGEEPMIFRKYNYSPVAYVEMMRMQGTGLNNTVRVGVNTSGATANSTFQVVGSVSKSISSTASALTLDESHHTVIVTANVNINLPTASTCEGRYYIIKKTHNSTSTITSYITATGGSSTNLSRGIYHLQSDGTNWQLLN